MLCNENDTIVSLDFSGIGFEKTLKVFGRNEIIGTIGSCLDSLLIKKALRKCRILGSLELGVRLVNSTYTGILGMYLRGEPNYLHEEWLAKTNPIAMEQVVVSHAIRDEKTVYYNLLESFRFGLNLSITYLFSFFAILAFSFLLNELVHRIRFSDERRIEIIKRIELSLRRFQCKRLSVIGLFVLFVHEFIWTTQLLLTNNIKTNKVVVDTSQLIKGESDLFETHRVACLVKSEQLSNMISSSSTKNVLSKVYYEKTRLRPEMLKEKAILNSDHCYLSVDSPLIYDLLNSDFYLFGERKGGNYLLANSFMFEKLFNRIWLNEKPIFEYSLVMYHNKNKPRLGRAIMRHAEAGFFNKMYECMDSSAKESCRASKITFFGTSREYIEYSSGFSDLGFANFCSIFFYYALVCSLVFVAFCVHHHLLKLIKMTHWPIDIILKLRWLQIKRLPRKFTLFVLRCLTQNLTHASEPHRVRRISRRTF